MRREKEENNWNSLKRRIKKGGIAEMPSLSIYFLLIELLLASCCCRRCCCHWLGQGENALTSFLFFCLCGFLPAFCLLFFPLFF